ncbi:hypothetical protein [Microbulbifer sp. 2205BS26-8]|uniref:hypothetical protein n=1 Tax=Microbulbifer sp. 2205BS26-8 TaxID=3064386 RepID=UPI00273F7E92|nr:hypothetical protein [Microbulbifer sp. 2205BS26-8]MDP5209853.1 hypothetical protein [Microbulbifer sp. 2205BS26-8]
MKNTVIYTIISAFIVGSASACDIDSDEQLVCEALMCSVGIFIPASHSECVKVQRDFAIYLATLGFWEDPPKCKNRDMNCQSTGNANTRSANLPAATCNNLNGSNYINCQFQVSKYNGSAFNCGQYRNNQALFNLCQQQFQTNGGGTRDDDGNYQHIP